MKKVLIYAVLISLILSAVFGGASGEAPVKTWETLHSGEAGTGAVEPDGEDESGESVDPDSAFLVDDPEDSDSGYAEEEEEDPDGEYAEEEEEDPDSEYAEEEEPEDSDGEYEEEEPEDPESPLPEDEPEQSPEETDTWKYEVLGDQTIAITGYPYSEEIVFPSEIDGLQVTAIHRNERQGSRSTVQKIVIPEGVTEVGEEAFDGFSSLIEVRLPSTLKKIGKEAFARCAFTSVVFPDSLEEIGEKAFEDHEITELVIPAGVKKIGDAAFNAQGDNPRTLTVMGFETELGTGIFGYSLSPDADDPEADGSNPEYWDGFYEKETEFDVKTISLNCYRGSTADLLYRSNVKKKYMKWGEDAIRTTPADRVLQAGLYQPGEIILELIIPEGVEELSENAFAGLTSVNKVTLPSTLKAIGARAFEDCRGLEKIQIPASVTSIGSYCFTGCSSLTQAGIPNGLEEIPEGLFFGCTSLRKLDLPKSGLKKIGKSAFENCASLTSLKMPKDLEEIESLAFSGAGLQRLTVPGTVTKIGKAAFAGSDLEILTLPAGMTEIPEELCYGATELRSVKFPEGVTRIGDRAFTLCRLSKLTLPEGLISIGEEAFKQDYDGVESYYSQHDIVKPFAALKSLKLPASLQTIGKGAFAYNDALEKLAFAKGTQLTEIGEGVFEGCLRLKELKLPDSVRVIGVRAFANCAGLMKADLGKGLTEIRDEAFLYDRALRSLTVPDTLVTFGEKVLEGYSGLTVYCSAGSAAESWVRNNYRNAFIASPDGKKK